MKKKTKKVKEVPTVSPKDVEKVLGECNDDCYKLLMKDGTYKIVPKEEMPKKLLE